MDSDYQIDRHYSAFCQFTGLHTGGQNQRLEQGLNKARQKLLKLSKIHFLELSTDVYDEMQRRLEKKQDALEPREDIHPRRNQARQKLSVLTESRFKDLSTDILLEFERRFPQVLSMGLKSPVVSGVGDLSPDSLTARQKSPTLPQLNVPDIDSPPSISPARYSGIESYNFNKEEANSPSSPQSALRSNTLIPTKDTLIEETGDDSDNSESDSQEEFTLKTNKFQGSEVSESTPRLADTPQLPQLTPTTPRPLKDITEKTSEDTPQLPTGTPNTVDTTPFLPSSSPQDTARTSREEELQRTINLMEIPRELDNSDDELRKSEISQFDPMLDAITEEETQSDAPRPGFTRNDNIRRSSKYDIDLQERRTFTTSGGYVAKLEETVKALEQSLHESEELKTNLTEENARLHAMVSDLEDMRLNAQEDANEQKKRVADLETRIQDMQQQAAEQNHAQSRSDAHETEKQALLSERQNTITSLRVQHDEHISDIQRAHALELNAAADKHKTALQEMANKSENKIQEALSQHSQEIDALAAKHVEEKNQLAEKHAAEKEELINEIERVKSQIADMSSQGDIKTAESDLYEENAYLKNVIQNLESAIQGHVSELSVVKDRHADALKKQNQFSEETAELTNKLALMQTNISGDESSKSVTDTDKEGLQNKLSSLQSEHETLQKQLAQQQKITEQVRKEAAEFLEEMRSLAENQGNLQPAVDLSEENQKLKLAVQEWKSKYSRAKSQLRSSRQSFAGSANSVYQISPIPLARDSPYVSSHGMVKDVLVSQFQLSVDEFLLNTRAGQAHELFHYLHNLVIATRSITEELAEASESANSSNFSLASQLSQASRMISNMANQLITVTRNHSTSAGLSPYSILDAAASDLSFAVVDAVKLAKIRLTDETLSVSEQSNDKDENDRRDSKNTQRQLQSHPAQKEKSLARSNGTLQKTDSFSQSPPVPQRSSRSFAKKKSSSSQKRRMSSGFDLEDPDNTIAELQCYLERKTVDAVDSIQDLLAGVRKGTPNKELLPCLKRVIEVTDSMVDATSSSMRQTRNRPLKNKGRAVVQDLQECGNRLDTLYADISESPDFTLDERQTKQQLAGISFDVAKYTKELVKTVEEVSLNAEIEDIDRQLQM